MLKQQIVNLSKKIIPEPIRLFLRKLNWQRMYLMQSGNSSGPPVFCPIANKEYKTFVRLGNHLISPDNGARSRQRLVWLYLKNEIGILTKQLKVLHIAPEVSYFGILKQQVNLEYTAGDKMMEGYGEQAGVDNIDLTDLPYDSNYFDLIICNHVLEHIPDDLQAMSEMIRVLSPGGMAVLTVPINEELKETYEDFSITSPTERKKHFGQWDHVRWYGIDIKERLEQAGFTVDMNRYSENFSKEEYKRFGLCDNIIVVARKTAG